MTLKTLQIGMGWFPEQAGGLNRVYFDCAHHLPRVGVEFTGLVAGSPQVAIASDYRVQGFAQRQASLPQRWYGVRSAFAQQIRQHDYALVASHFALYTLPILNQLKHQPLIFHFHGPWALESNVEGSRSVSTWFKKQIEQPCYQRASHFIVLSKAFQTILHQEYQVPLEHIHIIPGGVDPNQYRLALTLSEARQKLGWPLDRPVLLAVRRLARRMGLENLITAMNSVRQQHPDALLLLAGKGALQAELEQQIKALSLENHVKLLGYLPDEHLPLAYRAANVSIVPTVALEGFGLIVIESLAAGTPVLGTPVGGIAEILAPFCPGLLFEGTQPEQLAHLIQNVLSGQQPLPSASACQDYIAQHYTWPVVAQKIKQVYQLAVS